MDLPPSVSLTKRSLLRWFALSFGLISEKESRATILDVLDALFYFNISRLSAPTSNDLLRYLNEKQKPVSEKLLRYHLKRLVDIGLLQRKRLRYSFCSDPKADPSDLKAGFNHSLIVPLNSALADVSSVLEKLSENYKK
jgi:predicted transcriptional regulator